MTNQEKIEFSVLKQQLISLRHYLASEAMLAKTLHRVTPGFKLTPMQVITGTDDLLRKIEQQ